MMVAIPELDGATGPMVFGGRSDDSGGPAPAATGPASSRRPTTPRHARLHRARRHAGGARRQAGDAAAHRAGGAQGRRSSCSTSRPMPATPAPPPISRSSTRCTDTLRRDEARKATRSTCPPTVDALRDRIIDGNRGALRRRTPTSHARIPADDHVRREPWLREIEAQWGPAPGRQQSDGASIFVLGAQFGNVFVGVQPAFGYEGDPMRLLFEKGFAPTHAFSAFYRWLREDFGAMPCCISAPMARWNSCPASRPACPAECWPDRLIGDLPNFYLYAANNPSEGTHRQAPRRRDADQLPDAAGRPCRPLSRAARPEGVDRPLARPRPGCRRRSAPTSRR